MKQQLLMSSGVVPVYSGFLPVYTIVASLYYSIFPIYFGVFRCLYRSSTGFFWCYFCVLQYFSGVIRVVLRISIFFRFIPVLVLGIPVVGLCITVFFRYKRTEYPDLLPMVALCILVFFYCFPVLVMCIPV